MKKLVVPLLAVTVLTAVPAVIGGNYVGRWGTPPVLAASASRLEAFPTEFGAWQLAAEGEPLSVEVCVELGLAGNISRTYRHRESGDAVTLLLMAGQPGRLVRHPPSICYAANGNAQVGAERKLAVAGSPAASEYRLLEYRNSAQVVERPFFVAYGFSTGDAWQAPDWPRIEYGAAPMLFKLQALTSIEGDEVKASEGRLQEFLSEFAVAFGSWNKG